RLRGNVRLCRSLLAFHYAHDVFLAHHQQLIALHPHGLPGVFAEQHAVADLDLDRHELAFLAELALAHRHDFALIGFLRRGIRDDDAGSGFLLLVETLDDYAVVQWTDFHCDSLNGV